MLQHDCLLTGPCKEAANGNKHRMGVATFAGALAPANTHDYHLCMHKPTLYATQQGMPLSLPQSPGYK